MQSEAAERGPSAGSGLFTSSAQWTAEPTLLYNTGSKALFIYMKPKPAGKSSRADMEF